MAICGSATKLCGFEKLINKLHRYPTPVRRRVGSVVQYHADAQKSVSHAVPCRLKITVASSTYDLAHRHYANLELSLITVDIHPEYIMLSVWWLLQTLTRSWLFATWPAACLEPNSTESRS